MREAVDDEDGAPVDDTETTDIDDAMLGFGAMYVLYDVIMQLEVYASEEEEDM